MEDGSTWAEVREGLPCKADDRAVTSLRYALQLPISCLPPLSPRHVPTWAAGGKERDVAGQWRPELRADRTLVDSVSRRSTHKALTLVLSPAFLNQMLELGFSECKAQYTILYFETTVTRRPFQDLVNLIGIETKKDHFQLWPLKTVSSTFCGPFW